MCGFVGIWKFDGQPVDVSALARATYTLRHRGPDDEGYYLYSAATGERQHCGGPDSDPRLTLAPLLEFANNRYQFAMGFRRLSILDLSPDGHQPMSTRDGRFCIVYNGEIYNYVELRKELEDVGYKFFSSTDTEVVLASYLQWGERCVERFNGMWAFAIWDSHKEALFLSRDRFGIKPLYYCWFGGKTLIFGSEIRAVLAASGTWMSPSPLRIAAYLALGKQPRELLEETFFEEIKALPPANCLVVMRGQIRKLFYWKIPDPLNTMSSADELIERYRGLLTDAVRRHLRADVPVGSCLSGGLDSTAITLLMNRLLNDGEEDGKLRRSVQKTFSAVYSFAGPWNETPFINAFLKRVPVQAHFVYPDHERLLQDFEELIWYHEQPFQSLSMFAQWCVMAEARKHGVKVLLDGQGGDEILAGYNPFPYAVRSALLCGKLREFFRLIASLRRQKYPALGWMVFNELWGAINQAAKKLLSVQPVPRRTLIQQLANRAGLKKHVTDLLLSRREEYVYPTSNTLHGTLQNWVRENLVSLLRYQDRNSMRWSIESRVPYLDQHLVEFLFGLNHGLWIGDGWTKWIHRLAFRDVLPPEIVWRRDKVGFEAPDQALIRANVGFFQEFFQNDTFRQYVDERRLTWIDDVLNSAPIRRKDLRLLWRIINLAAWLEIMPRRIGETRVVPALSF